MFFHKPKSLWSKQKRNQFRVNCRTISPLNGGFDIGVGYGFSKHKVELKYRQTPKSDPIYSNQNMILIVSTKTLKFRTIIFERTFERMVCWWYF